VDNDLTAFAGGTQAVVPTGELDGYSQDDGSQHVNFIALSNDHVHELYRSSDPAAQWVDNDLTALAAGTPAGEGTDDSGRLVGYSQDDGSQHVNFVNLPFQHVHELYRSPDPAAQWVDNDLTALAGGTPAFGAGLAQYSQGDGSQHVDFNALTGVGSSTVHVHELYRSPDPAAQWVDNDLTALAGGTPALGNQLSGYSQSDGSQHVNFIDENGHVHELYGSP
jgi:hypothetical protein